MHLCGIIARWWGTAASERHGIAASAIVPIHMQADATMTTRLRVGMTCGGCAGAVKRILGKVEGVATVETDVEAKSVVVKHTPSASTAAMLEGLHKWADAAGKEVTLLSTAAE